MNGKNPGGGNPVRHAPLSPREISVLEGIRGESKTRRPLFDRLLATIRFHENSARDVEALERQCQHYLMELDGLCRLVDQLVGSVEEGKNRKLRIATALNVLANEKRSLTTVLNKMMEQTGAVLKTLDKHMYSDEKLSAMRCYLKDETVGILLAKPRGYESPCCEVPMASLTMARTALECPKCGKRWFNHDGKLTEIILKPKEREA